MKYFVKTVIEQLLNQGLKLNQGTIEGIIYRTYEYIKFIKMSSVMRWGLFRIYI